MVLLAVVALTVLVGPSLRPGTTTRGSGVATTEHRAVASFAAVDLQGAAAVTVRVGDPRSVTVSGDDNVVGLIRTQVGGGVLRVDSEGSFATSTPLRVSVVTPILDAATLSGAGQLQLDQLVSRDADARLDGSGQIQLHVTRRLRLHESGTGSITYRGHPAIVNPTTRSPS
jgi:hypothetical protein